MLCHNKLPSATPHSYRKQDRSHVETIVERGEGVGIQKSDRHLILVYILQNLGLLLHCLLRFFSAMLADVQSFLVFLWGFEGLLQCTRVSYGFLFLSGGVIWIRSLGSYVRICIYKHKTLQDNRSDLSFPFSDIKKVSIGSLRTNGLYFSIR
ncbi:hypothetical protein ZYGR_0AK06140 [Zygosaccharomyces rouxii]|uniref:Uncharacterized protein n=1 Tax=Zygosaccharomyces rouxii TaxID=4956 RepID=A0A1Q3AEK5_ZYGRO|nr:hypothetical protein ZYGR_0AK06140 [Zygosaccharomyces rouxii]